MATLKLRLLGSPVVEMDGALVEVKPRKALAILVYLACAGRQSRETLAALFWPESGQRRARASLRGRLWDLDHTLGGAWLQTSREYAALADDPGLQVDVSEFEARLAACEGHGHGPSQVCASCRGPLEAAVALYGDDFLTGFTLPDCPEFDDWQFFRAEDLRLKLAGALQKLITLYSQDGGYEPAIPHARRWLSLDPLHEPAHQELMRLYALAGQQSAALRQYQLCADILQSELGVPVSDETRQLRDDIQARTLGPPESPKADSISVAAPNGKEEQIEPAQPVSAAATPRDDEIRVLTVLAADLSLSLEAQWDTEAADTSAQMMQLMGRVPSLLAPYDAQISRHFGSGFQALFGLSQAHEDDAERAIRAAMDIRSAAQEAGLALTMGINSGAAYVVDTGTEQIATGPTVTLAARLQALAQTDEILVGETTYRQTQGAVHYAAQRPSTQRTVSGSPMYRVERLRSLARKARGVEGLHANLVGRDEELGKMRAALTKVQQGEGQMVALIAEAGVGKSRLVAELRSSAPDPEDSAGATRWLEGRCLEMTTATAYAPFVSLLHDHFGWAPDDSETVRAGMVVDALEEMVQQRHLRRDQVSVMGPILGNLLSIRYHNEWDLFLDAWSPEQVRYQTFQTLADFLMALAKQQRTVLVLEDLHWADTLSLDLIALLMERLAEVGMLLLCLYRPEPEHRSWQLATIASRTCPGRFTELHLRELTPQQTQELLDRMVGSETLSQPVKDSIYAQCHGNPFFLEEILHGLIDRGVMVDTGTTWEVRGELTPVEAPAGVQSVTLSRVDRLAPGLKGALQHASVLGRRFDKALLAALAGDDVDVDAALDTLEERAFVFRERSIPEEIYSFRHVLAQQAIYQTLPPARRIALHGRAGAALEQRHHQSPDEVVELLAYHFSRSDLEEKAICYLLQAAQKSRRAYLTEEAAADFRRALERLDAAEKAGTVSADQCTEWRLTASTGLGQINAWAAQFPLAEDYFRQAIALGKKMGQSPRQQARLYFWLGEILNWQDKVEESIGSSLEALSILGDDVECAEAAMVNAALAWSYQAEQDIAQFVDHATRCDSFLYEVSFSEEMRAVYDAVCAAHLFLKNESRALWWMEQHLERSQQNYDLWNEADAHESLKRYFMLFKGDTNRGLQEVRLAAALFRKVGDRLRSLYEDQELGRLALHAGNLEEADLKLTTTLEAMQKIQHDLHTRVAAGDLALLRMAQHRWQEAANVFADKLFHDFLPIESDIILGRIHLAQGQREAARQYLGLALERAVVDDVHPHFRFWATIGWRPRLVDALSALEEALEDSDSFFEFCRQYQATHREISGTSFRQWHLEHAAPDDRYDRLRCACPIGRSQPIDADPEWVWHDAYGDCSYEEDGNGITLYAAMLRDLWFLNRGAPRLLRQVNGDFAAQTVCRPAYADRPGIGGLLLWQDQENYLRLGIGIRGQSEVSLEGCIADKDVVIGRGRLVADGVTLRLERSGSTVRALCSADGREWFSVGQVEFPASGSLQAGLHAIGNIDRTVYFGAYPDGAAIRFTDFLLWN